MITTPRRRTVLGTALAALPLLGLAACGEVTVEGQAGASAQLTIIDDQEREIVLPGPAQKAVVLNSYTNEFLRAIGAGDRVVGVDRASLDRLPYIDLAENQIIAEGLDQLNYEAIAGLEPDVVVMPRNAVWQEAAEQLEAFGIPLIVATAWDTEVVDETLTLLGQVFGRRGRRSDGARLPGRDLRAPPGAPRGASSRCRSISRPSSPTSPPCPAPASTR